MGTNKFYARDNTAMDYHRIQGGVEIFLDGTSHRNQDRLWPDGLIG